MIRGSFGHGKYFRHKCIVFSDICLGNFFSPLSSTTSYFTINSSLFGSRNANLELDFGVSIRSSFSPFPIIPRIFLSPVTFFHLFKRFLRFPPLKFWISLVRTGMSSDWTFKIVLAPTLLQLRFSFGIAIVDNPIVVFRGYCNFWFGCCCCTPLFWFPWAF